MNSSANNGWSV